MEASGLVCREPDPVDKRISRVFLTPKGSDMLIRSREAADQIDQISFAGFSPEEQALMNGFLERVHTNLTRKE
jgi:DNA-binding MarR family transcriptional regulator